MRIVVIGATGTIGKHVVQALSSKHEVIPVGRNSGEYRVDISDPESVRRLYANTSGVDAVVCVAGEAKFAPLESLSDEDFAFSLKSKLMGQVNVVRYGLKHVADGGSITLTSGVLSQKPMKGSGAVSLVNAGVEGFGRAAALEAPRGIRVNVVSPGWVAETLQAMGQNPSTGIPASLVARAFVSSVEGPMTGMVISAANPTV
jgi:NAD(P)-dependent dehydrogenase (short-subunit alcohol dehydrogenase family)